MEVLLLKTFTKTTCPIAEKGFDQRFGCYQLSLKIGDFQAFNSFSYSNQRHYHDSYELVIVTRGSGDFEHNGTVHTLKSGDLFIANPFAEHEIHVIPSESMTVFYLFFKFTPNITLTNSCYEERILSAFSEEHSPFVHDNTEMLAYLNFISDYRPSKPSMNDPWISRIVFDFLFNSLERLCVKGPDQKASLGSHDVTTFERILDYIDQNMEKRITAVTISEAIGLSRRTLYNMFHENMNCTVHTYIKVKKIALAKHYLTMNLPVSEVAGLVGYESLPQFSRIFKEHVGISPRAYVKEQLVPPIGLGRRMT